MLQILDLLSKTIRDMEQNQGEGAVCAQREVHLVTWSRVGVAGRRRMPQTDHITYPMMQLPNTYQHIICASTKLHRFGKENN